MQFHIDFLPDPLPQRIRLASQIVTIGSCFADVIGQRLVQNKLNVLVNPFGTIFNPISIAKLLTMTLRDNSPDETLYVERNGIWFHYDFHSSLWGNSREELREKLHECLIQSKEAIRIADFLFITLGSAIVYRYVDTHNVVANCHKMPGQFFEKYLYQLDHLREPMVNLLKMLRKENPNLNVVLTVSPVRHTRDTLPLNSASKATLRILAHELTVWNEYISYFPVYELMMDDLRDYRFYEADLIHPNTQAHEYIFEKFAEYAFHSDLRAFIKEWSQLSRSLAHRPLYGDNNIAYQQFLQKLIVQLEAISKRIDVSAELAAVRGRLEGQEKGEKEKGEGLFV